MNSYDFTCPICKEQHQFFTGRMTFGTPNEILSTQDVNRPHPSITVVDNHTAYLKGVIRIPVYDIEDGYALENWMRIPYEALKAIANEKELLEGTLLYSVNLFPMPDNMEWQVGYDTESDEFLFLAKDKDKHILDWQMKGISLPELRELFAKAIHAQTPLGDQVVRSSKLEEVADFLLTAEDPMDRFVHVLIDNVIIFQLGDARRFELLQAPLPGIGVDIPIDESVQDEFRDRILTFPHLSAYHSEIIDGIRVYQFNYERDLDKLKEHVHLIATNCYGVEASELVYELNE